MAEEERYKDCLTYILLVLDTLAEDRNNLSIVVTGCGDSTLPDKIYDLGYHKLTCFDLDRDTVITMMKLHSQLRKDIKWRLQTKDTIGKIGYMSTNIVIDKGALDALGLNEAKPYLRQVEEILNLGGRFICFMRCNNLDVIELLLHVFYVGYKMTFQKLVEDGTMVVAEKVPKELPHVIPEFVEDSILCEAIRKENSKRLQSLYKRGISLSDVVESGVIGNPRIIYVGRKCRIVEYNPHGSRFDILVFDIDMQEDSYSWEVFFTKPPGQMWLEEEHWSMLASHAEASRVYVVFLDDMQDDLDLDFLQTELGPLFEQLAPRVTGDSRNSRARKIDQAQLLTMLGRVDSDEGDDAIRGSISTTCPHTTTGNYCIRGACSEVDQCAGGYSIKIDLPAEFHVDRKNVVSKRILVEEEYDSTLTEWLLKNNKEKDRWAQKNEGWNDQDFLEKYKLDKIEEWNASRPTDKCCQIIEGLNNAVFDYNSQRMVHGNLSNTDSYLMRWETVTESGLTYHKCKIILDPTLTCSEASSFSADIKDLKDVIFNKILMGKTLPRLWSKLQSSMSTFGELDEGSMFREDAKFDRKILKNHPSFWHWKRRCDYFENIWMRIHQDQKANPQPEIVQLKNIISSTGVKNTVTWKTLVPENTPIHRMLKKNKKRKHLTNDDKDIHRYMRTVFLHVYEEVLEDLMKFVNDDEEPYKAIEFIEVVLAECFPNYIVDIFEKIVRHEVDL